jgi:ATP-dependent Lhr-like helicase
VLSQDLDVAVLLAALQAMQAQRLVLSPLARPGPFAFPLMVERFREQLTNEALADRIARMLGDMEAAADAATGRHEAPPEAHAVQSGLAFSAVPDSDRRASAKRRGRRR